MMSAREVMKQTAKVALQMQHRSFIDLFLHIVPYIFKVTAADLLATVTRFCSIPLEYLISVPSFLRELHSRPFLLNRYLLNLAQECGHNLLQLRILSLRQITYRMEVRLTVPDTGIAADGFTLCRCGSHVEVRT